MKKIILSLATALFVSGSMMATPSMDSPLKTILGAQASQSELTQLLSLLQSGTNSKIVKDLKLSSTQVSQLLKLNKKYAGILTAAQSLTKGKSNSLQSSLMKAGAKNLLKQQASKLTSYKGELLKILTESQYKKLLGL